MAAVLARLNLAFEEDPRIDEYAILPEVSAELFGSQDGDVVEGIFASGQKLAISVEAALRLYCYTSKAVRSKERQVDPRAKAAGLDAASRAILMCCADSCDAWSHREAVLSARADDKSVDTLEQELRFNELLLRTNHKSGEAWAQRRRLLAAIAVCPAAERPARSAIAGAACGDDQAIRAETAYCNRELMLVEELAKKYAHHYYAWTHWAWLQQLYPPELVAPPRLAHATPSHYGLFHHRVVRLSRTLLKVDSDAQEDARQNKVHSADGPVELPFGHDAMDALSAELALSDALLATYPHLEATWAFRSQLFAAALEALAHAVSRCSSRLAGERTTPSRTPSPTAVLGLWRSEREKVAAVVAAPWAAAGDDRLDSRRFWLRLRAHNLQEMALYFGEMTSINGVDEVVVEEMIAELEDLEADTLFSSAAQVALISDIRMELGALP
eukprot:TRINITY_DN31485_c0_g1_i1.p1 TRINITY_DN31485_c0_g1~~TRINITY_DN31485_c0_g1_i1.p1  ORF type:complete len:454 (-),score=78.99 TRINITY_DN31485_c0_g1_i1:357-1685(-)